MQNKNYQKKGYNKNNKRKNDRLSSRPFNKVSREMKEEKTKEIIAKQTMKLEIINHIADYLEDKVKNNDPNEKVYIQSAIQYVEEKGYAIEEIKKVSTIIHCMMDLSWADRKFDKDSDKIKIRIAYIKEILSTMCRPELHDKIQEMIIYHPALFPNTVEQIGQDFLDSRKGYKQEVLDFNLGGL